MVHYYTHNSQSLDQAMGIYERKPSYKQEFYISNYLECYMSYEEEKILMKGYIKILLLSCFPIKILFV